MHDCVALVVGVHGPTRQGANVHYHPIKLHAQLGCLPGEGGPPQGATGWLDQVYIQILNVPSASLHQAAAQQGLFSSLATLH